MTNEEIKERINLYLIQETDFLNVKDKVSEEELRLFIDGSIVKICRLELLDISDEDRYAIIREIMASVVSMGPLRELMEDESITEIMVNGPFQIYVQRAGKIELVDVKFNDNRHLAHVVQKMLAAAGTNKRVDESSPYVDFTLTDGSRVNVIAPPLAADDKICITIRKFKDDIHDADDLIKLGMLDERISNMLKASMAAKLNVVFSGATGAGKTTALNVFSKYIPEEERIVTIEDTQELRLKQDHVVSLVSRQKNIEGKGEITIRDLFVNCLRMRPDRIIIGEVRGEEMLDMIQSVTSGHSGSLAIIHGESSEDCFDRMVTMTLMTGIRLSTGEIKKQVAKAIDLIVHVELYSDGVRRISNISDSYFDEKSNTVKLNKIFEFVQDADSQADHITGRWVLTPGTPSFMPKLAKRHITSLNSFFTEQGE